MKQGSASLPPTSKHLPTPVHMFCYPVTAVSLIEHCKEHTLHMQSIFPFSLYWKTLCPSIYRRKYTCELLKLAVAGYTRLEADSAVGTRVDIELMLLWWLCSQQLLSESHFEKRAMTLEPPLPLPKTPPTGSCRSYYYSAVAPLYDAMFIQCL